MGIATGANATAANFNAAFASKSSANTLAEVQTNEKQVVIKEISTPSTPASGYGSVYFKTDGELYVKNDAGTESQVSNQTSGSGILAVSSKTTTYTAATSDDLLLVSGASASWTLTLFTAVGNTGKVLKIKRTDNTIANTVTVDGNGSETIDGSTTVVLCLKYQDLEIVSDGTNWQILNHFIPTVAASAKSSSVVSSSSGAALVIGTSIFDTTSSYNTGTGVYTIPIASKYEIGFTSFEINTGATDPEVSLYKNGSKYHIFGYMDAGTGHGGGLSGSSMILDLSKGDTIHFALSDTSGLYGDSATRGPMIHFKRLGI